MTIFNLDLWEERDKTKLFAGSSAVLFTFSWLMVIDAKLSGDEQCTGSEFALPPQLILPGIASSIAFFVMMFIDVGYLYREEAKYTEHPQNLYEQRALLFVSLSFLVASFVTSAVVLNNFYVGNDLINGRMARSVYPGIALLLQSLFVPLATVFMKIAQQQSFSF